MDEHRNIGTYQWGYMCGRLARTVSETIKTALTGEAVDEVLREFRRTLAASPDGSSEPARPEAEAPAQPHYS